MKWEDQGLDKGARYTVIPRTLTFLTCGDELLLLRGAPHKRLWANKLNGIGGHIEPDEDPLAGAQREIREESGLELDELSLRAAVHVAGRGAYPGVIFFVFVGQAPSKKVRSGDEGELCWYPLDQLPYDQMVEDLPLLIPHVLNRAGKGTSSAMIYGHYVSDDTGHMQFHFTGSA
jgi:8-oxo-dGTP diphosphatase